MTDEIAIRLLRDILEVLESIDRKVTPAQPAANPTSNLKHGRVFSSGDTIPYDVDLVMADGGLRWCREFDHQPAGSIPLDNWYPRDVDGPVLATTELLSRARRVTEIPAPTEEL